MITLGEQLDGAELVRYDLGMQRVFAWFGGESTMVHVYTDDGEEVDAWTCGGEVDQFVINDSIERHIKEAYNDEAARAE